VAAAVPAHEGICIAIECQACGQRLQVVADNHEFGKPALFSVGCTCGRRLPFPEPVGMVRSVTRAD
jgi:hypothetical protein